MIGKSWELALTENSPKGSGSCEGCWFKGEGKCPKWDTTGRFPCCSGAENTIWTLQPVKGTDK